MRRSRLGLIALGMAMVVYLGFLLRHFHEPGSSNNGLQQLVRTQAADITRLKQQLAILQNRVSSAPAAVPCSIPSSTAAPSQHADGTMLSSQPKLLPLEFTEGENFLLATRAEVDGTTAAADSSRVVRGLLSSARFLKRTLLLPPGPLSSKLLATPLASELLALGVRVRPAANLTAPLAEEVKCSHVRIETPHGLDSEQFVHALRHYATTRILEIDLPHESYCGPSARASSSLVEAERALDMIVQRAAGGVGAAPHAPTATSLLGRCHHSLKEEEVSQYWDMGKCKGHRVRVALPEAITRLPRGSDLMVTFSTGGVATMAHNWVEALRRAGVTEGILIGALDQPMRDECARRGLPCVAVAGDNSTTSQLSKCREKNIRMCPAQYPKMSILKVGFYRELLSLGFNVFACDADAIFMNDPRPLMRIEPWVHAEVAIATDCIDLPGDAWRPLLHCDFNTGLVFMRGASQAVLDFTETWREKVANAKEARIRDQAAFNMITKAAPGLTPYKDPVSGREVPRVYLAARGSGGSAPLRLGVLPLDRFLNGHTFFVQHVHTLPGAKPPISVHMTYQFAEGSSFSYGKRQRLREAGLWFVDQDSYYTGKYLVVSAAGATLPPITIARDADSRDAVRQHLAEHSHLVSTLRAMLGMARALGRRLVLPRMLCYCDYMWKEMKACRVGGAESMRLPFDCPMDHVLDTPSFFENKLGVEVREPNFLLNPRVSPAVNGSVARVTLPATPLDDAGVRALLAPHADAAIIELDAVAGRFCGFADAVEHAAFLSESERVLTYDRVPFCTMEGSDNAPLYSRCCTPWHEGEKFFPCVHGFGKPPPLPACK